MRKTQHVRSSYNLPSPSIQEIGRGHRSWTAIRFDAAIMLSTRLLKQGPHRLVSSNSSTPAALHRRRLATLTGLSGHPKVGETLHGFRLKRTEHIPELQLTAFHFTHQGTGAAYLHLARDDKNNVFSISFKTNPPDRTGVPHILEHITLCGSEKYSEQRL